MAPTIASVVRALRAQVGDGLAKPVIEAEPTDALLGRTPTSPSIRERRSRGAWDGAHYG
jgi:hypothetical protein